MGLNNIEYCVVPISHSGKPLVPLENIRGLIKSSDIENMLEIAAMNLPLCRGAKRMGIFEYRGELRAFFASRASHKYILGEEPVASYPLN